MLTLQQVFSWSRGADVNNDAVNTGTHASFKICFSIPPRSGTAGSYGSSAVSFLRNLHIVLHSVCTNLHSTHSVQGFLFPHPHQDLLFVFFLMIALLTGVR